VYTGGRYWLNPPEVELVLRDNGYDAVDEPREGDVIAYRNDEGVLTHSGLVRVAQEGVVLIESKWGPLGRYLHRPEQQAYGQRFTYHRSDRAGHVVAAAEGPDETEGRLTR
jgi:hypothetical protein